MDPKSYDYTPNTTGICPYCDARHDRITRLYPGFSPCEHLDVERMVNGKLYYGFKRELTESERAEIERCERLLGV